MTPLTVSEARAILAADRACQLTQVFVDHGQAAPVFEDDQTATAWRRLVESARQRITAFTTSAKEGRR